MADKPDALEQMSGNAGIDAGGDPGDQAFVMNRKVARLAGNPTTLVDRDFQRLQRQSPRSLAQNTPTRGNSLTAMLLASGKARARGKKKF